MTRRRLFPILALALIPAAAPAAERPPKPAYRPALVRISPDLRDREAAIDDLAALFGDRATAEEESRAQGARAALAGMRDVLLARGVDPDLVNDVYAETFHAHGHHPDARLPADCRR